MRRSWRRTYDMGLVISNSSTLIHLSSIGRLELLREFFGKIVIPQAVWEEVVAEGRGRAGAEEVRRARSEGWVEVSTVSNEPLVRLLERDLDRGEAEVIALAIERKADLVLLDESDARRIAELFDLRKTGIVGLLIRAKREGRISSLREELDRLRGEGGFWIGDELYLQALKAVGEV